MGESKIILNFGWYFRLDPSTPLGMTYGVGLVDSIPSGAREADDSFYKILYNGAKY